MDLLNGIIKDTHRIAMFAESGLTLAATHVVTHIPSPTRHILTITLYTINTPPHLAGGSSTTPSALSALSLVSR